MRIRLSLSEKNHILDHPKNLLEVLRPRLVIVHGLTGNKIIMGPNQYRFTKTFLDGETLHVFNLKLTELRHENVANLVLLMHHVVTYVVLKESISKQKRNIRFKIEKPASSPQVSM